MIGLDSIQNSIGRKQRVPRPVRLEVIWFRVLRRMKFQVGAQVCKARPASVGIDLQNGIRKIRVAMPSIRTRE
jgi:hypothetical protein